MPRKRRIFPPALVIVLGQQLRKAHPAWARRRLFATYLLGSTNLPIPEIMAKAKVSRQTLFTYQEMVLSGSVSGLLRRKKPPGRTPVVRGIVKWTLKKRIAAGEISRFGDAHTFIYRRTGKIFSVSGLLKMLAKMGVKVIGPESRLSFFY